VTQELLIQDVELKRPALRWHGGKWALAPWIISHFPEHRVYVEPFGGAASVLLRKPRSRIEVYNDLDSEVVNFFQVLRDPVTADKLCRGVWLTPFSREEYRKAFEPTSDPVERARRLAVRCFSSFGTTSANIQNDRDGFRWKPNKSYAAEFAGVPNALQEITQRLRGVLIEQRNAFELIGAFDAADTLFFVDPPYVTDTRNSGGKYYAHEMDDREHRILAHILKRVKGKVILCGYPSSLYDGLYADWRRDSCGAIAAGQKGGTKRTEVIWMNF
jgi:DNA adenine methylase